MFNIGDEVVLSDFAKEEYIDHFSNPHDEVGTIIDFFDEEVESWYIEVEWPGGYCNQYRPEDLELYWRKFPDPAEEELKELA